MVRNQALSAMTIGKFAAAGGVGVETVRFYQRRGLLAQPDRNGGVRRYDQTDLSRLRFIRQAQGAGFTLDEIGRLLEFHTTDDRARARMLAEARIVALDARIAELQSARSALAALASECAKGGEGPCPILLAFEA